MSTDPDGDDEGLGLLGVLDEEVEAELDRLAAELPAPRRLPRDLHELLMTVESGASARRNCDPEHPPTPFGRFEVFDAVLGGMGMVLEARDPQLDRKVAIKLWCRSGPEANAALLAEAQTLAKFSHPNVVTVYEPAHWHDRVFFVMEWVEGVDAHTWIDTPMLRPWAEIREVFIEAGKGLAAAHDQGIQHRDFKPANMLVGSDGRVRVADFGVAASLFELGDESEAGWIVGTPSYMAPERLEGGRGDARSDQFSFCVAMWRGLYGQRPYAGDTHEELLRSIAKRELRAGRRRRYVPLWLKQAVRKGLAESPDERHADMHALVRALVDGPDGDDERPDSNFGEAVLKRYGGHLNAPRASDPRERRVGFVYGVLAMFMVTMLGQALLRHPIREPPTAVASNESAVAPDTVDDPLVTEVVALVHTGEFDAADRR